jgi:tyrosyl-tRNA synthetase
METIKIQLEHYVKMNPVDMLVKYSNGLIPSRSQARRLIEQKAIKIFYLHPVTNEYEEEFLVENEKEDCFLYNGTVVKFGKKDQCWFKLIL